MGHKHSTFHREPSCDLTSMPGNGSGPYRHCDDGFIEIKHGPFKRKLSMRNISIRRSFHMGGKNKHNFNNRHYPLRNQNSLETPNNNKQTTDQPSLSNTTNLHDSSTTCLSSNTLQNGSGPSTSFTSTYNNIHNHRHQTPVLPSSTIVGRENKFVMDRLRKSFRNSFRKKKHLHADIVTESQKPHQWQSDEHSVRSGTCVFPVKYLGCVEVFESRGMQICEDALRRLRNSRRRGVKGQLYVTGDGIRVVDDDTKGLIVDQTIEKVSFCAPDRSHERGFSYICRDGTTRRWMCHGFHATKDSGERLSHAVGCAFNICLERKQKRDKESVSAIMDANNFQRSGSFRQSSITERLQDPQVAKPSAEPVPVKPVHNPYAVARPHATASLLQRQGSLRGGPLNHASPFKRQLSLRLNSDDPLCGSSLSNSNNHSDALKSIEASFSLTSSPNDDPSSLDNIIPSQRNRAQSLDLNAFEENGSNSFVRNRLKPTSAPNNNFINNNNNLKVTLTPSVAPIRELSPTSDNNQNNKSLSQNDSNHAGSSTMIAAMCQQLSQGLSMLSAKNDCDVESKTTTVTNGTGLPPNVVKDTNSLFTFSNIDQWISTTPSTTTNGSGSSDKSANKINTDNIIQQLNTGSLDSGIAHSGSSLSSLGKSAAVPAIPPAIVDQMPQMPAPPPPSSSPPLSSTSPSTSPFSSIAAQSTTSTSVPISSMTTATTMTVNHNSHNPFLSNITEKINSEIQEEQTQSLPSVFKSTNPFLDLSQFSSNNNTTAVPTSTTKSFTDTFESVFDLPETSKTTVASTMTTTTASTGAPTQTTQMVKAFEVSM